MISEDSDLGVIPHRPRPGRRTLSKAMSGNVIQNSRLDFAATRRFATATWHSSDKPTQHGEFSYKGGSRSILLMRSQNPPNPPLPPARAELLHVISCQPALPVSCHHMPAITISRLLYNPLSSNLQHPELIPQYVTSNFLKPLAFTPSNTCRLVPCF
jgi:hypothetical protein